MKDRPFKGKFSSSQEDTEFLARKLHKQKRLIDEIIERAQTRTRADIARWRSAIQQAENIIYPRRQQLIKVYDEVYLDPHLRGIISNTRKNRVVSQPFKLVDKNGKENKEATAFFYSQWFFELLDYILDAQFWGHSLVDLMVVSDKVYTTLVPRLHVEPLHGHLLRYEQEYTGIPYREDCKGYFIEVGRPRDLGLMNPATPYVLFKKNAMIAWSEYCDIFGMPIRTAYTTSNRKEDLDRLEVALKTMGKAAYGIFRKGIEEFDLAKADGGNSGTGNNVYDQLAERSNSEISKLILGSTMTSDVGKNGSRAQAVVHEGVAEDVVESDKRIIQFTVNDQLIPNLIIQGLSFLKGLSFQFPEKENQDQIVKWLDTILKYKNVPDQWITDKLGIPVEEKSEPDPEPSNLTKPKQLKGKEEELMRMHNEIAMIYSGNCDH